MRRKNRTPHISALVRYRDTHHRDIAGLCETRLERDYSISTIWTINGTAKTLANQTDLLAAMCRAAIDAIERNQR